MIASASCGRAAELKLKSGAFKSRIQIQPYEAE